MDSQAVRPVPGTWHHDYRLRITRRRAYRARYNNVGRFVFQSFKDTQSLWKENVVVAKYIDDPLLVNGYKWDLRLYVVVTSFNPLVVYLYEEGLVRFATVKYVRDRNRINNRRMHLCNYSVNKNSPSYVR